MDEKGRLKIEALKEILNDESREILKLEGINDCEWKKLTVDVLTVLINEHVNAYTASCILRDALKLLPAISDL